MPGVAGLQLKQRLILRILAGLFCLLLPLQMVWGQDASAEKLDQDAPVQAELTPDAAANKIRELTLALKDRKTAEEAFQKLVKLGESDDRVASVLEHLVARSVYPLEDELVFIPEFIEDDQGNKIGQVYDLFAPHPEEGQPVEGEPLRSIAKSEVKAFRPQTKVRRQLVKVVSVIRLKSSNPDTRLAAAKKVGDKRDIMALEEVRALAETDPDEKVRQTAKVSLNLILASGLDEETSREDRFKAVATLGELKSIRALDMLEAMVEEEGVSGDEAAVLSTSIGQIKRHISFTSWVLHVFRGISLGSILILIALGLAITFGLMGVINMAHGEMLMIGAIMTWGTIEFLSGLESMQGVSDGWFFFIAFPVAFCCAALVGLITEVTVVRHLYKRPLDSLLATIGISFILIQGVRLITGDNLSKKGTEWVSGGFEVYLDIVLPYNRLFIIGLCIFAVLSVVVIFRYTSIGLMIRATVQNREMAQSLGVNTRMVDMFTFSLGAGLAGVGGYGYYLISNVTPDMGQDHIVRAFLTVVVGGVGKLIGVVISGLSLGSLEKLIEPIVLFEEPFRLFDAGWAIVAVLLIVAVFMQRRPSGLFPDKGRLADQPNRGEMPWLMTPSVKRDLWIGGTMIFLGLVVIPMLYLTGLMSPVSLNKFGQYAAFALVAIGLDLVWGYMGVLSLCQFLFFALGGYCMGFYMINHGPVDSFGIPKSLAYVMSDVTDKKPPWFLAFFHSFPIAVILGILISGVVAFVIGATTFRSRIRGVYFSIFTQAVLVAFWNVFIKNDMKLGGTNGLTKMPKILGFNVADKPFPERGPEESWFSFVGDYLPVAFGQTRFWLYIVSIMVLFVCLFLTHLYVRSRFGRILVAIRDDETRLRFSGYQTWMFKALTFTLAGVLAAIGGMLFVPQKGIITPKFLETFWSIMVVVYVAVGGRATLWGPVIGTFAVSILYDTLTSESPAWYSNFVAKLDIEDASVWIPDGSWLATIWSPEAWLLVLGALFVAVPLFLPGGLMSLGSVVIGMIKTLLGLQSYDVHASGTPTKGGDA